ncbi:hypothetical protein S83_031471, partial [Arachis hypogaea]
VHMQENSLYEKFRNKGLPFKDELSILFKDVMADVKFAWAPSYGMLPSGIEKDGHVDIEESSGDSEEGIGASVGYSKEYDKKKERCDAISRISSASESRSTIVSTFLVSDASIAEVMTEIQKMEMITSDFDFHS